MDAVVPCLGFLDLLCGVVGMDLAPAVCDFLLKEGADMGAVVADPLGAEDGCWGLS